MTAQNRLIEQQARFFVIDANKVARDCGMGGRINTVMQVCFFAISGVLPAGRGDRRDQGFDSKDLRQERRGNCRGEPAGGGSNAGPFVRSGNAADTPAATAPSDNGHLPNAPAFVRNVLGEIMAGRGDRVPVSALPNDGTFPTGTARWEKRNLAAEIPVWDPQVCIQCGKCVLVCPHAVIRSKVYPPAGLGGAPRSFKSTGARLPEWKGLNYTLQVAAEDCTGCGICVDVCPARNKSEARLKAINMQPQLPLRETERANWDFFLSHSGAGSPADFDRERARDASATAAVRVLRRVRRLRRDALHQVAHPVVRRSAHHRQCDRLLVDLRRQSADHALHARWRRARPGLGEFALRRQRRVRSRLPRFDRQAAGVRRRTAPESFAPDRAQTRRRKS